MSHSVASHLSVGAGEYDAAIRRFVPHYDEMLAELVAALGRRLAGRATPEVIDLGAGTGSLAARVLATIAGARVTVLDADPAMLKTAEERLAAQRARLTFLAGSFLDPLPPCDAAVASLSLHHVFEPAAKRTVYASVRRALRPGGVILVADAMLAEAGAWADDARAVWAAHLVAHGDTEAGARERFATWAREDFYVPIADELASLRAVGFADVDVVWRRGPVAVIAATG